EPELVIAATPQLNGVMALALREASGTPVIYDVRGFPEMTWATRPGGSSSEIYRLRRTAETRCALEADAVITTSETVRGELTRRGIGAECVAIVPQVVDLEAYSPRARPAELARSYGLDAAFVAGSISSLLDYEGIDLLLRALALARAEREDLAV